MREYEARVGLGDVRTVTLPSMVLIMMDPTTKAHVRKDNCTTDIDKMKREVEGLLDLYKPTRPTVPIGLNAMGDGKGWAAPTWQDPDEGYTQEEWDAWDVQQTAEHAERQRLYAIGKGKSKGLGKGGWQQKGKGKGRGKDGERIVRDPNAAETWDCDNCRKPWHLAQDCPEPDSAQTKA